MKTLAIVAAACTMIAGGATAAPFAMTEPANQALVQQTHWRGHGWGWGPRVGIVVGVPAVGLGYGYGGCRGVRHVCADRWSWGGPGFGRCMWRHGC
jgi:hypothetical protein